MRHPDVRLRRRTMLGWHVLMENCPACCEDQLRRLKEMRRARERGDGIGGEEAGSDPGKKGTEDSSGSRSRGRSRPGRDGRARSKSRSRVDRSVDRREDDVDGSHQSVGPILELDALPHERPGMPRTRASKAGPERCARRFGADHRDFAPLATC